MISMQKRDNSAVVPKEVYPRNSAGHHMIQEFLKIETDHTVGSLFAKLKKGIKKSVTIDYIYVVGKKENLLGVLSFKDLFLHSKKTRISSLTKSDVVTVSPHTDVERAAKIALAHNIKALPVVEGGVLLGVVTSEKIHSIVNKALRESILQFAGIHKSHLEYENTMEVPLFKTVYHRVPWLVVGLVGIIITAGVINFFDFILHKYVVLAFFIPAIVYMSDALGTQHQTLFIRDLAILGKNLRFGFYFFKQMLVSFIIGLIVGILVFSIVSLIWKETFIAFIVALSIFIALIITSFMSLVITLAIDRLGMDPALGSGPFATVLSDLMSVIIYFVVATILI